LLLSVPTPFRVYPLREKAAKAGTLKSEKMA
jgi:hypothetical protein